MQAGFFQDAPGLGNLFSSDALLQSYLTRTLPESVLEAIRPELDEMGGAAVTRVKEWGDDAEAHPPVHVPYDAWGERTDRIEGAPGWDRLREFSAARGLVATGYERVHGVHARVHQHALIYLFAAHSAGFTCPLAMTDGAARLIELSDDPVLLEGPYKALTSRDPDRFWTSGQWMTERAGGSDVGRTETMARRDDAGRYRLDGTKWFTSAVRSQMAMTLARTEGAPAGSHGLSLFYVALRDEEGRLQGICVNRLKDKLGTRAVPTAELALEGCPAQLVGKHGEGVKRIVQLMNITRMWNATCAVSGMRLGLMLARDYATKRSAFGRTLAEHPLHRETLADMAAEQHAAFHLAFRAAELLGLEECGEASPDHKAELRLLTPLLKLYTAKQAVRLASETLEAFGGAGYVEDTGLPRILRDAQVLTIWEGTTNILSLDALRAIAREEALAPFLAAIQERLEQADDLPDLAAPHGRVARALASLEAYAGEAANATRAQVESHARRFAYALASACASSLLLAHAAWAIRHPEAATKAGAEPALFVSACRRFVDRRLVTAPVGEVADTEGAALLALAPPPSVPAPSA
ncbi:MAG: acyl-CoA dehydrogenase family protein [Planctomycetota bacterium]|jgi:alkylation response protein AidB-like acyl-CoA dehydrogenase